MKVIALTSTLDMNNGWGCQASNMIRHIGEAGVEYATAGIVSPVRTGFGISRLDILLNRIMKNVKRTREVISICNADGRFDLIHSMTENSADMGHALSQKLHIPHVITANGTYAITLPARNPVFREAFAGADRVVSISEYTKKRMAEERVEADVDVVNPGVDKKKFCPDPNVEKTDTVLFVGNLKRRKGIRFILEAFAEVNRKKPEAKLLIVGNINRDYKGNHEYRAVADYISKQGINAEFTGKVSVDELVGLYRRAKLNVLPSKSERYYFEGFGLIHLEANACGTFTVGTYDSGNEDAITDGRGALVNYGDVADMARILLAVLDNPPEIDVADVRSWNDVAADYIEIYENVTGKRVAD